jgi:hypothetical protein
MRKIFFLAIAMLVLFSCSKEELPVGVKEGKGTVWLSGGLMFCAEQIRMDCGDTLIVAEQMEIYAFKSGERVLVKYKETGAIETACNIGKNCELIEIEKTN